MNNCSLVAASELDANCAGTLGAVRLPQREQSLTPNGS
jgi:hypothetical protein